MEIRITKDEQGNLLLWAEGVPGFLISGNENLVAALEHGIQSYREDVDIPYAHADREAGKYAEKLEVVLASVKSAKVPAARR